jgi:methionine-rich copper-binding protein CopC
MRPMRSINFTHPTRFIPASGLLALLAALAALAAATLAAPSAFAHAAHAGYVRSNPAANAVVKTAPTTVTITFAEAVNPSGSAVTIYDANGKIVSGAAQVEPNDLATMRVPMTADDSEVYLVVWHTVSATDGDPDVGAFNFFVSASGTSDLAAQTTSAPTTGQTATGAPAWLVILIGLIGLLVGLAGGVVWSRRAHPAGKKAG